MLVVVPRMRRGGRRKSFVKRQWCSDDISLVCWPQIRAFRSLPGAVQWGKTWSRLHFRTALCVAERRLQRSQQSLEGTMSHNTAWRSHCPGQGVRWKGTGRPQEVKGRRAVSGSVPGTWTGGLPCPTAEMGSRGRDGLGGAAQTEERVHLQVLI